MKSSIVSAGYDVIPMAAPEREREREREPIPTVCEMVVQSVCVCSVHQCVCLQRGGGAFIHSNSRLFS